MPTKAELWAHRCATAPTAPEWDGRRIGCPLVRVGKSGSMVIHVDGTTLTSIPPEEVRHFVRWMSLTFLEDADQPGVEVKVLPDPAVVVERNRLRAELRAARAALARAWIATKAKTLSARITQLSNRTRALYLEETNQLLTAVEFWKKEGNARGRQAHDLRARVEELRKRAKIAEDAAHNLEQEWRRVFRAILIDLGGKLRISAKAMEEAKSHREVGRVIWQDGSQTYNLITGKE